MVLEASVQLLDRELHSKERTRHAGDRIFVEFHLKVDDSLTVSCEHDIVELAEATMALLLPATMEVYREYGAFGHRR